MPPRSFAIGATGAGAKTSSVLVPGRERPADASTALRSHCHSPKPLCSALRTRQCRREGPGRWRDISAMADAAEASTSGPPKFSETELKAIRSGDGSLNVFPDLPGVYGIFSESGELQYLGLSRKVSATLAGYARDLPDLAHSVKLVAGNASREQLVGLWKAWMQQAVDELGQIPPGNAKGNETWVQKRKQKGEIKLTPGKGAQDLTCSITDLIDQVVKSNKVVAFVKGSRSQPQCGFSYKVLSTLNELGADYEVLDVLDELHNPGLREAIKQYSQWPTIPQLYVGGEFLGGADIIEEMHQSGELKAALSVGKSA